MSLAVSTVGYVQDVKGCVPRLVEVEVMVWVVLVVDEHTSIIMITLINTGHTFTESYCEDAIDPKEVLDAELQHHVDLW